MAARREYWFSTQLASLQRAFAETANGPRFPGLVGNLLWLPQNDVDREFCTSQVCHLSLENAW